jgi:iron complex outermembrane receptor protein
MTAYKTTCRAGLSMIALLAAMPALAQTAPAVAAADNGVEEIIVSAQRRDQSVTDVPVSITVFSGQQIAHQNIQGLSEYFVKTPNVSFISTGARDRKEISIRGITNQLSVDTIPGSATFGFYIDEFNVASGTVNPEIVDIARVEVLRGPQGTYFGRNAVGGAINITTNQPVNRFEADATINYSSFNTINVSGVLNVPIVDDKVALRVVGRYDHSDGNIKNINPIGGGNDSTYRYGKAILRLTPVDRLTIDFTGAYTKEDVGMREGVPSGVVGLTARSVIFPGITNPAADPDGVGFFPDNTNRVNFNRPQTIGTEFYYLTGRVKYEGENVSLTSITGYINSKQFLMGDIDGSSKDYFYETKPINRNSLSQEIRLQSSNPNDRLFWTFGGLIARDRGDIDQHTFAGSDNPFGLPSGFQVTSSSSKGESTSYALFGEATYKATDKLSLTLGGRYTHEKVQITQFNTSSGTVNGFVSDDAKFDNFSPRISVAYQLADKTNIYATISRGFKAGGVQINPNLADKSYKPETLTNYEIGFKTQAFDRRLSFNAAAFYMNWTNLQTEFAVARVTNNVISFFSGIENAASARSYGFEIDSTARLTDHLTLGGGIGYLDAKFSSYDNAFINGKVHDLSGFQMPNSPKWTLNASAEYTFEPVAGFESYVRGEWIYRSSIYSDKTALIFDSYPYKVPSFNQTNLRIGFTKDKFDVQVYAENLFNNKYFTNAYEKAFAGGLYVQPAVRRFGIRASVHY